MARTPKCRYGRDMRYKSKVRCRKTAPKRSRSPAAAMALEGHRRRRRR